MNKFPAGSNKIINITSGSNTTISSPGSDIESPDQGNINIGIIAGGTVAAALLIALCVKYQRTKHLVSFGSPLNYP
jgi:hypothetical protein